MRHATLVLLLLALPAADVTAQSAPGRIAISVGGGVQTATSAFQDRFDAFEAELQEKGGVTSDYGGKNGTVFDGGFAIRLRSRFRAGVAVSYVTAQRPTTVEAQVPHPFHFNRHRAISGEAGDTDRKELGIHGQLQVVLPLTKRLHAVLAGGPTYFDVEQPLVDSVQFTQQFPFDTATFQSATTRKAKGSGLGFNAGVDVVWTFSPHVGVGGSLRFARGTVDLESDNGRNVSVEAGSLQGTAGLRFFF